MMTRIDGPAAIQVATATHRVLVHRVIPDMAAMPDNPAIRVNLATGGCVHFMTRTSGSSIHRKLPDSCAASTPAAGTM
jgi:hypothetical protein